MFRYSTDIENFKLALPNHLSTSYTGIEDRILSWKALPVKIVSAMGRKRRIRKQAENKKIHINSVVTSAIQLIIGEIASTVTNRT
jgi:hypothetical protein